MEIFIPNLYKHEIEQTKQLKRTTHLAIMAHHDDIEVAAYDGIKQCFGSEDKHFTGVVVTDGSGSPRSGAYAGYTGEEMKSTRKIEQKKASIIGEYCAQIFLDYSSAQVKDSKEMSVLDDIKSVILKTQPSVIYTHNLADKHETHVAVCLRVIGALRQLTYRAQALYGCEVWRDLDWMCHDDKVKLDVAGRDNIELSLLGVFDSQIAGGKRYDSATMGRRLANATFSHSHGVDETSSLMYAMDLTPLIIDSNADIPLFVLNHINKFGDSVTNTIKTLL